MRNELTNLFFLSAYERFARIKTNLAQIVLILGSRTIKNVCIGSIAKVYILREDMNEETVKSSLELLILPLFGSTYAFEWNVAWQIWHQQYALPFQTHLRRECIVQF